MGFNLTAPQSARWSQPWWTRLTVAMALAPGLTLIALHWHVLPSITATDYAQYILHAKALLEGRPYADTGYLYTEYAPFIGPRMLPPGLPLTLVPFVALFGTGSPLLRMVMVVSVLCFVLLVWRYIAVRESPWIAAGVAAMLALSVEASYASTMVVSDPGFCALIWALIATTDGARARWSWGRVAGVALLGFAAMAYRVAAVALVPAFALWGLLNFRRTGWRSLVPVLVWCGAALALALDSDISRFTPAGLQRSPMEWFLRLKWNVSGYKLAVFDSLLYPFPWDHWNDLYHLLAAVLMVVGAVTYLRSRPRCSFLNVFAVTYGAMLLLAPVKDGRYLWPLYPLIVLFFLTGVRVVSLALRSGARVADRIPLVVAAVVTVLATVRLARLPDPPSLLDRADVQGLFEWVRDGSPAHAGHRYVFGNPRVLSLETGVTAMGWFEAPTVEAGLRELGRQGITHLVLGDLGFERRSQAFLERMIAQYPERFTTEFENETFRILRFHPPADGTPGAVS